MAAPQVQLRTWTNNRIHVRSVRGIAIGPIRLPTKSIGPRSNLLFSRRSSDGIFDWVSGSLANHQTGVSDSRDRRLFNKRTRESANGQILHPLLRCGVSESLNSICPGDLVARPWKQPDPIGGRQVPPNPMGAGDLAIRPAWDSRFGRVMES
jgi:hypothetical protein